MEYKLAKELMDAGFPQTGRGNWFIPGYTEAQYVSDFTDKELLAYAPTLEELIEACKASGGYTAFVLSWQKNTENWMARLSSDYDNPIADGATPAEAVARLWLALNKHE